MFWHVFLYVYSFGVHPSFWICRFISLTKFGEISAIISLSTVLVQHSFSSFFWNTDDMNITFSAVCFLCVFQREYFLFFYLPFYWFFPLVFILLLRPSSDFFPFDYFIYFYLFYLLFGSKTSIWFFFISSVSLLRLFKKFASRMSVLYLFTEAFFMMSDFTLLSENSNICIIMVLASLDLSLGTWGQHSGEYPDCLFASHVPHWVMEKLATWKNQWTQAKTKTKTNLRKTLLSCCF